MEEKTKALNYFGELSDILSDNISVELKYTRFRVLLEKVTKDLTQKEVIQFSNLFSRLSFVCEKHKVSKKIHGLRITANKVLHEHYKPSKEQYNTHLKYLSEFISKTYQIAVPQELKILYPKIEYQIRRTTSKNTRIDKIRVEVIEIQNEYLICNYDTNEDDDYITVKINEIGVNERFSSISNLWKGAQLYLVNIEIDEAEVYHPKFIILEPDYLVDISSIAECSQDYGITELNFIKSKFEEIPNTKHIRLGNFANLVIDELFAENIETQVTFRETIKKDFQSYPFEYTTCSDISSRDNFQKYLNDAEMHFTNIKRVVLNDFPKLGISIESSSLEPAFLCELYGIQGRLDILELKKKNEGKSKIIELKSGGVPFPDDGLSIKPNHKSQLYLYYQLIGILNELGFREVAEKTDGYILYSKIPANNIRFDKPNLTRVQDILDMRNKIIINEFLLASDDLSITKDLISKVTPDNIINGQNVNPNFRINYLEPQILEFSKPIKQLDDIEQSYFYSFVSFIAKEQYLAKLGNGQYESNNGLANLWLNSFSEKADKFEILYDLTILNNQIDNDNKEISFVRTNKNNEFVNFRKGDICVLYPRNKKNDTVTNNQIFKCSIKKLTKNEVVVSFRYKQRNTKYFEQFDVNGEKGFWALERDFMDSSFRAMYKNLYLFITYCEKFKRQLLLTTERPNEGNDYNYRNELLSEEQNRILKKALSTKNYFLINGPPGTGKTSIIIKELVRELYKNKDSNILILAYTNRAVDELCEAVNNAIVVNDANDINFIRIGNELSCSLEYKNNLLLNLIKSEALIKENSDEKFTRDDIKALLNKHRVYISTATSMSSKMDLFELKNFDTIIVDEASQILEPQIIGILPKCSRFILIGDHKQLPAIVLQEPENSKTNSEVLESIGLENRKNSLFERLYTFCENNGLDYAFDKLTYQGRMHKDIALFPSHSFYDSNLKQAFDIPFLSNDKKKELERQVIPLNLQSSTKNTIGDLLSKKRLIFFPSKKDTNDKSFGKRNIFEAELVVKIVEEIKNLYSQNNKDFDNTKTIGIIAPFRNQIALIKQKLEEARIPNYEDITVDTVERYQGSQRDIIIISFAINNPYQLKAIINPNDDGSVDRKLNVALTRAKEQLILIGNDSILSNDLIYFKLIEFVKSQGGYILDLIADVLNNNLYFNYFDSDKSIAGKIYTPDNNFSSIFDELIINTLRNDERTISYPDLILGQTNDFIRNNVIEYGRTNFDAIQPGLFSQGFGVQDKVNLYCFYNMRKHYFSSYSIFESYSEFFSIELEQTSGRLTFIDFGCGPMTSGIAFHQIFKTKIDNYNFNYFGIDISNTMLERAESFSRSNLFNERSTFHFTSSIKQIDKNNLEEQFRFSNTVILNFSYIFSNLDMNQTVELANDINKLISEYPLNKYIIVYQNPIKRHHNFSKFKSHLNDFDKRVARKSETVSYKNQNQGWYDKTESFTYEILTN